MTDRNERIRFCENNFVELQGTATYSSQVSDFPFTNAKNNYRNKVWIPKGNFEITTSNNKVYVNDGTDKTATITVGSYDYDTLANEIAIRVQAASGSGTWACAYSTTTQRFTISRDSSFTLKLSTAANAVWDTIGFTTVIDLVGLTHTGDQVRNHTSEWCKFDFGAAVNCSFMAIIGPLGEDFTISPSATVTLEGNNIDDFTAPPFSVTGTVTDNGVFRFNDDQASSSYRYWVLRIVDRTNPLGPQGIKISNIYLGDYVTFTARNLGTGFSESINDPSESVTSTDGTIYFNERNKFFDFSSMEIGLMTDTDKAAFENMYLKLGSVTPFYISIDPLMRISPSIDRYTKYVIFGNKLDLKHVLYNMFNISFSVREVQ